LLLNPETTWICFHGGFDFAYFMKTVTGDQYLPDFEDTFMEQVNMYFPNLYDLKFMKHNFSELKGGLNRIAEILDVTRAGPKHQAGSDSLVTLAAFFKFKQTYGNQEILQEAKGVLFGLGKSFNDESYYMEQYQNLTTQQSQLLGEQEEGY
jgi:CCR4-NOT transcription complex subunit 7/8